MDKIPCLRAYAPSGIRTHDPLIMSREHEPIYYIQRLNKFSSGFNKPSVVVGGGGGGGGSSWEYLFMYFT